MSLLATYQKDLSQRHYIPDLVIDDQRQSRQENVSLPLSEPVVVHSHEETVWLHDAETLAWIKKMQQQKGAAQ